MLFGIGITLLHSLHPSIPLIPPSIPSLPLPSSYAQVKPEDDSSLGALSSALEHSAAVDAVEVRADSQLNTTILPAYDLNTKVWNSYESSVF
jgi:hypothetical protein